MSKLRHWFVLTPEYEVYCQSELEPAEYGCDVVEVEATTRRDAIIFGVREMLRGGKRDEWTRFKWCLEMKADGRNPFAGVTAASP